MAGRVSPGGGGGGFQSCADWWMPMSGPGWGGTCEITPDQDCTYLSSSVQTHMGTNHRRIIIADRLCAIIGKNYA